MKETAGPTDSDRKNKTTADETKQTDAVTSPSRRKFISRMTSTAAVAWAGSGLVAMASPATSAAQEHDDGDSEHDENGRDRALDSFQVRRSAALAELKQPVPAHKNNGDEHRYHNKIGSFHKGLPHDAIGEVDLNAYEAMIDALESGKPGDFENIPLGGNQKLVNPQSGLAFDLEGTDSQQLAIPPAPTIVSAQRAGEMVEDYWMALLRDVNFTDYATDASATAAIGDLNKLTDFRGPKQGGKVTPQTLFRGFTAGDVVGPYLSQFLLQPFSFGALRVTQRYTTYPAGTDYMTDQTSWLEVENGQGPFPPLLTDATPRYIRNGRDLSAYVHVDGPYQPYVTALLGMSGKVPFNVGNPYNASKTQAGFTTFGVPQVASLVAEVANRALKAVWYQKWFVHRHVRPEAYAGLVHMHLTHQASYPIPAELLNSHSVPAIFAKHSAYFLPMAYPEGSPQHPSYAEGHGSIAGACVTILKAFFATDAVVVSNPVVASPDGLSLVPYTGADAGQMTVTNELNKLANNIGLGRDHAGVHWRSDSDEALRLGEAVAISILRDQRHCYNESFPGFTFKKFDGTTVTV